MVVALLLGLVQLRQQEDSKIEVRQTPFGSVLMMHDADEEIAEANPDGPHWQDTDDYELVQ